MIVLPFTVLTAHTTASVVLMCTHTPTAAPPARTGSVHAATMSGKTSVSPIGSSAAKTATFAAACAAALRS